MQKPEPRITRQFAQDGAVIAIVLSLFLGAVGPYGSFNDFPIETRMAAWIAIGLSGYAIYTLILFVLERIRPTFPWIWHLVITAFIGGVVLTPAVDQLYILILGAGLQGTYWPYVRVFAMGCLYLLLFEGARQARQLRKVSQDASQLTTSGDQPGTASTLVSDGAQRFMKRLPTSASGVLLCLMKEDHYLRVYTDQGDCLIRLRMSDAMSELEDVPGLQVHRSWWVADHAVVNAKRRATGGAEAILTNKLVAPIARARVNDALEAGWFDRSS